ncbi:MAG: PorP/SprF family type IX secretion system membrane protein [Bacteroidales bacterium]|jgi:type IX secretion system PorP/SprF family membrane protein|nr:PorP/SprF family type IX secretion system membrane protein [Bacteroidales bacterium]MDD4384362.1 PorP/SprF family type IX secretion system membrane protein [Bacteroidales bacterium]MDY0198236.1 PorP/SprF family type IX secretion system membrane protein [Tenuifilaceae bacterium]
MLTSKKIFLIVFFVLNLVISNAQDASFSQPFSNQLYLNPAYAGHPKYQRLQVSYRNQWLVSQSPFMTYGVSYDRFFIEQNSGLGINVVNDMQSLGAFNNLNASILYSYTFQIAYNFQIRGGIQAGGVFKSQNTRNLIFPDMVNEEGDIVGTPGFSGKSKIVPDFAAGVLAEWDYLYGGVSVHHLSEPVISGNGENKIVLSRKYTAQFGAAFNLYKRYLFRKSLIISPNIIYQQQLDVKQVSLGLYLRHHSLESGLWLKERIGFYNHTIAFLLGYHNEKYSFAYSYDFSIFENDFRGLKTSSHEVTFAMYLEYKTRSRKKTRTINSPIF